MAKNFSQFTSETTPALTDHAVGYRTAASGGERRTLLSAVYALFKTSFDSVYAAVSHTHAQSEVTDLVSDLGAKAAASDLTSHTGNTSNPHSVTKAQVGLTNVDDTSDAAKPVSTATQTALDLKAATADVLEKTNTTAFTPSADYHPATKKYVDDNSGGSGITVVAAPVANNSTGSIGEIAYDGFYKYTCVATDTWVRSIIETTWS